MQAVGKIGAHGAAHPARAARHPCQGPTSCSEQGGGPAAPAMHSAVGSIYKEHVVASSLRDTVSETQAGQGHGGGTAPTPVSQERDASGHPGRLPDQARVAVGSPLVAASCANGGAHPETHPWLAPPSGPERWLSRLSVKFVRSQARLQRLGFGVME